MSKPVKRVSREEAGSQLQKDIIKDATEAA